MGISELNELRVLRDENQRLKRLVVDLAGTRVGYGYPRLMVLLRREGLNNCHSAVYRIYREDNLGVKRKRAANLRTMPVPAQRANERWAMDFATDRLETGRAFRVLTLIDQYTRECPLLEPGASLTGRPHGGIPGAGACHASVA